MPKYVRIFLYSFLFSPFFSYIIVNKLQLVPYYFFGTISIVLFVILLIERRFKIIIPKYIFPLFLFLVYYSIWDFFNGRYEQFGVIKLIFKNYPLHIFCFLLIIENIKFDEKFIKKLIISFKFLIVISFIFTLIQVLYDPLFFTTTEASAFDISLNPYQIRNTSLWGYLSPLDVGLSFLPIFSIVLGDTYYRKNYKQFTFFFVIGSTVAIFTNDRWVHLNLLVLILLIFINLKNTKFKNILILFLSIIVIAVLISNIFSFSGITPKDYLEKRILSDSAESRILALELFLKFFPQNPIFGTGVRVDSDLAIALSHKSSQIHVGYLSALYEFGIIGGIFLFYFWFLLFRKFQKSLRLHNNMFLIIGYSFFLLSNLSLVRYSVFHIGLLFIIIFNKFYYERSLIK